MKILTTVTELLLTFIPGMLWSYVNDKQQKEKHDNENLE